MQAVLLPNSDKMWDAIKNGSRKSVVKRGNKAYDTTQPLILCSHQRGVCVLAHHTSVSHKRLADASIVELASAGFNNIQDAMEELAQAGIKSTNEDVTILTWRSLSGFLVEEWR